MTSKLQPGQSDSPSVRDNPAGSSFGNVSLRWAVSAAVLTLAGAACLAAPASAPTAAREAAVTQARAGDASGALHLLKQLVQAYPDDPRLLADATLVANWAGDDSYALGIYGRPETPKYDAGVVEAAARSARNLHKYEMALQLFSRVEALSPGRWQPQLGYAMVLTDQGNYEAAEAKMKPLLLTRGDEPDVERGEAYLCERQENFACSVGMYQRLLKQDPQDAKRVQCQMAGALSHLGANSLAQGMCDSGGEDNLRLEAAVGAERVRWAESIDHDWQWREAEGNHALTMLDRVIAASDPADPVWRQAQSDRLLALYDLFRMPEVVTSWEQLRKSGIKVPDYALERVASAYLAIHRPQEAEALYRGLEERSPADGGLWSGLAFAEFESEHIRQSFSTVDHAYGDTPAWLQSPGLTVPQPNRYHASLALQAAQMRGFAGMPGQEQKRLSGLLEMAPADPKLGRAMALTYLERGWALRAVRQERIADSFEQKSDLPVLEDAQVMEGAGRRKDVDALLGPLLTREGRSPSVVRFLADRAAERGWQANITSGYEWSSGRYLGNAWHSEAYLYSPFLGDRWRIYGHGVGDTGQFVGGSAYRSRAAAGFRYDYSRQSFWGEAAGDSGSSGPIPAGAAGARFSLGDHWVLALNGDSDNLSDVQLIAALAGIRARSGSMNAEFRVSELSSIHFQVQRMLFSDGNQRSAVAGGWNQRLLTAPRLQIEVNPQVWASANSKDQSRVYFNPRHDVSYGSGANVDWITWRHYEHSFLQRFTVYAAPYWEENYGTRGAVSGGYTQLWKVTRRLGFIGRFAWHGQPYDGIRQPYTDLSFGLTWGDQ